MKRLLFIFIMILLNRVGFTQEVSSRSIILWKHALFSQELSVTFKEINIHGVESRDTVVTFFARNQKYKALTESFMILGCSKEEFFNFVETVKTFYEENKNKLDDDMRKTKYLDIDKNFCVSIIKQYGVLGIEISRGSSFHSFRCVQLMRIFDKYIDWYNKEKKDRK